MGVRQRLTWPPFCSNEVYVLTPLFYSSPSDKPIESVMQRAARTLQPTNTGSLFGDQDDQTRMERMNLLL
ncbi:hypothetical protein AB1N83_003409 [Pleurotus pulmonarius]